MNYAKERPSRVPTKITNRGPYTWHDGRVGTEMDIGDYQVIVRWDWAGQEPGDGGSFACIQICRADGGSVFDWRDMQAIKNLACGPEWFAVEIFPPESELKDPSNARYLWCSNRPMPFGLPRGYRLVLPSSESNAPQRPFEWEVPA